MNFCKHQNQVENNLSFAIRKEPGMTKSQYDIYNLIYDGTIVGPHSTSTWSMIGIHFKMVKS